MASSPPLADADVIPLSGDPEPLAIDTPATSRRRDWKRFAWVLAVVVVTPLLLILFLHTRWPQHRSALAAASFALAGLGLVRWTRGALAGRRDLLAALLIGSGSVVGLTLVWNEAYMDFVKFLPGQKEVFRPNMQKYFAPFYGRPRVDDVLPCLPLAGLVIAAIYGIWKWRFDRPMKWWGLPLICVAQLAMILALAATDLGRDGGSVRVGGLSSGFQPFREDARYFRSIDELYAAYINLMPQLNWFSQHYPPGPQTIFVAEWRFSDRLGLAADSLLRRSGAYVTAISVCLATVFVYLSAASLSARPRVRNAAAACFAGSTGVLLFPMVSVTPILVLPGAVAVWAMLRAFRSTWLAAPLGVVMGGAMVAFTLFSFSAAFFGLVIGLLWLACVHWRLVPLPRLVLLPVVALLTAAGLIELLFRVGKFDLMTCALVGVYFHHKQMSSSGFDSYGEWFFRSTGNLLAFALNNLPLVGVAVASALMWRRDTPRQLARLILPAATLAILISGVSGKFFLETERIWTLFLPFLALGAAVELCREEDEDALDLRAMLTLLIVFVAAQEVAFAHGGF